MPKIKLIYQASISKSIERPSFYPDLAIDLRPDHETLRKYWYNLLINEFWQLLLFVHIALNQNGVQGENAEPCSKVCDCKLLIWNWEYDWHSHIYFSSDNGSITSEHYTLTAKMEVSKTKQETK